MESLCIYSLKTKLVTYKYLKATHKIPYENLSQSFLEKYSLT